MFFAGSEGRLTTPSGTQASRLTCAKSRMLSNGIFACSVALMAWPVMLSTISV